MAPRSLFSKLDNFLVQEDQKQKLTQAVWRLPNEALAEDDEELATKLAIDFTMELPVLDIEGIYQSDRQMQIDARRLPNRMVFNHSRPVYINGTEITIHVPFKGDPAVFDFRPSTYTLSPPVADIDDRRREVLLVYQVAEDASMVKTAYERTLQEIRQHLDWLKASVTPIDGLKQVAKTEIAKRKQANQTHENVASSLGLRRKKN